MASALALINALNRLKLSAAHPVAESAAGN